MQPSLVDIGVERNVARIAQHSSDFSDREPIFFDPLEVLIKLALLLLGFPSIPPGRQSVQNHLTVPATRTVRRN